MPQLYGSVILVSSDKIGILYLCAPAPIDSRAGNLHAQAPIAMFA